MNIHLLNDCAPPEQMQAAVWQGGTRLKIETVPVPSINTGELLVQVEACGLCPTDIKKIDLALMQPPVILGHEMAGRVVATGGGAESFLGKRVALYHHVPCRTCELCRLERFSQCPGYKKTGITAGYTPAGGGWAEYIRVMPWIVTGGGVVEIPEALPVKVAILMEPLNTCLKCIRSLPGSTETVILLGQGPVGLMLTALLQAEGKKVYAVEPLAERKELALRFGAEAVFDPSANLVSTLEELGGAFGPDAAIAATESEAAINAALKAVRPGGTVILFAHTRQDQMLQVDAGQIGMLEKQVIGSYSSSIELNHEVKEILLDPRYPWQEFVTRIFPLEEINQALDMARNPTGGSLKVAVAFDPKEIYP